MKRFLVKWWPLLVIIGAGVVLLLSSGTWPGGGPEASGPPGEQEEVLPDPPAPVLVRWRLPPGKELVYEFTSQKREQLGQIARVRTVSGSLVLRARGADRLEAEFVIRKEKSAPTPTPESEGAKRPERLETSPGLPGEGEVAVPRTFTLDLRGRVVGGASGAREFYRIFGGNFTFPEEGLRRGVAASSKTESRLGQGGSTLLVRGQTWVRTVRRNGYPCLRIEAETSHHTVSPTRAGYRAVTESTSRSVYHFAYDRGFIVELTLEQVVLLTSSSRGSASVLAGATRVSQEASLRLLQVRSVDAESEGAKRP